ncbi:DUF5908 family protein [Adhaeribacter rhizoryzae]|uniref:Uncharacterized protein n=1 Tax=Adhaeribacter rhizoryzae TaxID=2607907 RepID=A0A5M6DSP5_9BACT|nr:DUF5908 family protein [Adhaeribacter rhizoryzae]KAA5548445.1 hypothetical protein F0145_06885 [Adhaeribacter rhizoryzae]
MPIEIRELHIKVVIDPDNSVSQNQTGNNSAAGSRAAANGSEPDREALIAECLEQVMTILRDKNER